MLLCLAPTASTALSLRGNLIVAPARLPLYRRPNTALYRRSLVQLDAMHELPTQEPSTRLVDHVQVSTFNLWCPAYRRLAGEPDEVREADFPEQYMQRNQQILALPLWSSSHIICAQEFWYSSPDVFDLYVKALSPTYRMHGLQRAGGRPDGLFMAISRDWEVVHELDLDFEDAAGRCAQVLHLRRTVAAAQPPANAVGAEQVPSEMLVANVHLLFPHNEASARIRVREVHKLLSYLDAYKRTLPRPPPALICGDINGNQATSVVQFLKRYGWESSYMRYKTQQQQQQQQREAATGTGWVSHFTHEKVALGVDYIFVLNPSTPRLPVPEWTDFVFMEMAQQLARQGFSRPAEAWLYFHQLATGSSGSSGGSDALGSVLGGSSDAAKTRDDETLQLDTAAEIAAKVPLDAAGFRRALRKLDLERGDALGTLTEAEVQMLIASCDRDGDNSVDGKEWCDRFGRALQRLSGEGRLTDRSDDADDLCVSLSQLQPSCLEDPLALQSSRNQSLTNK